MLGSTLCSFSIRVSTSFVKLTGGGLYAKIKAHKQAFRRALRILYWVGLMILYLCAASRPGVWLRDAFLYRQTDGSFAGRDEYGIYALTVTAAEHETQAVFAMNGETIQYRIVTSSQENVQIYQDDRKIFAGQAIGEPGDAVLWAENGQLADDINVVVNGGVPTARPFAHLSVAL